MCVWMREVSGGGESGDSMGRVSFESKSQRTNEGMRFRSQVKG